MDENVVA